MPINPLDRERSWPDKQYGPSNFYTRPNETRSRESARQTPDGLRQMEAVIWDAASLYREQVEQALSAGEYSPDAIIGLADLIGEARAVKGSPESRKKVEGHKEMLLWALRLYDKIPDAYKRDPHKGHPSLVQQKFTGEKIIQFLEQNNFQFEKKLDDGSTDHTSFVSYDWENAARILRIVARYLDETARASS